MAEMRTEAQVLSQEATNFDRIAQELSASRSRVMGTAGELQSTWTGQAGTAAQQAIVRFQEGHNELEQQLRGIVENIRNAGVQYESADTDQASTLSSQMNI